MKVRLIINLGTTDKQRFGLKDKPAMDGDVVDVTEDAAATLKSEGKALDTDHPIFKEKEARQSKTKGSDAGAEPHERGGKTK